MAAASLAEVYEAQGKDGQRLAVKVQYSDLRERHETDIATVRRSTNVFLSFSSLHFSDENSVTTVRTIQSDLDAGEFGMIDRGEERPFV